MAVLTACSDSGGSSSTTQNSGNNDEMPENESATNGEPSTGVGSGGAQGSGGNLTAGVFSQRVTRVTLDYDNNGVVDAEEIHSYDNDGRLEQINYQYIGDGTNDIIVTQDPRALTVIEDYNYNNDGRVSSWTRAITPFNPNTFGSGIATTTLNYQYDSNGLIDQVAFETYFLSGALAATINYDLEYNSGQLTRVIQQNQALGLSFDVFIDFSYDGNGLPEMAVMSNPATTFNGFSIPASIIAENSFFWNSDFKTSSYTFLDVQQNNLSQLDTMYTPTGKVDVQDFSSSANVDKTQWVNNSTWTFNYDSTNDLLDTIAVDMSRDGSEDAIISMEWEEEDCASVYLWHPLLLPLYPFESFTTQESLPSAILPGTGYRKNGSCAR